MAKRHSLFLLLFLMTFSGGAIQATAQKIERGHIVIRRTVDLVQMDVAVTDKNGNYITGLRSKNFAIYEDGILQKLATFGEEDEISRKLTGLESDSNPSNLAQSGPGGASSAVAGHSVFILFDTSDYMYRGFVFAQDAITEFIRSLDRRDRVAFYSYSRDFSRPSLLTADRSMVLRGVRSTVAGDNAALYNALLLTLEDAAQFSGRRVVVVFSNGPDNSSAVAPEDVLELSQSEGIPIYMISTRAARLDPVSTIVFERMSDATGGKAYFARNWEDQQKAFASIREDLAHLYSLSYYPQPNPNRGWRKITVKLTGMESKKYHIRTRSGYRPEAVRPTSQIAAIP